MTDPVLLVQLSDLHVGANENGVDPIPRLKAVIEAVRGLPNRPDAVLVSGDLTDDGVEENYRVAREILARLDLPLHVLPGNHDDRRRIRETFDMPGEGTSRSTTRSKSATSASSSSTRMSPAGIPATSRLSNFTGCMRSCEPRRSHRPCWRCTTRRSPPASESGTRSTCWRHSAKFWPRWWGGTRSCARSPAVIYIVSQLRRWPPGFAIHVLSDGELSSRVEMVSL